MQTEHTAVVSTVSVADVNCEFLKQMKIRPRIRFSSKYSECEQIDLFFLCVKVLKQIAIPCDLTAVKKCGFCDVC